MTKLMALIRAYLAEETWMYSDGDRATAALFAYLRARYEGIAWTRTGALRLTDEEAIVLRLAPMVSANAVSHGERPAGPSIREVALDLYVEWASKRVPA